MALKSFSTATLLRKNILQLKPYTPIEPFEVVAERIGKNVDEVVKLDANENLYGPPPQVLAALGSMKFGNIYPDPESRKLRTAISKFIEVPLEYLLVGCGADELIDLLLRCILDEGDGVIDCPPTFTMYLFDVNVNGGRVITVERHADFSIDVPAIKEAVLKENAKAIFLTSPNNPDGSLISDEDLKAVLEMPVLVVLDEAYLEFAQSPSRITWVPEYSNLVVLRTFSKSAALAGIRVGYGAFPLELVAYLWRAKQPYNVSVPAELAACVALENIDYMLKTRDLIVEERERLFLKLQEIPFLQPQRSQANFILCKVQGTDAVRIKERLYQMGILVRHYQTKHLSSCIRISVGRPQDTDALIDALHRLDIS